MYSFSCILMQGVPYGPHQLLSRNHVLKCPILIAIYFSVESLVNDFLPEVGYFGSASSLAGTNRSDFSAMKIVGVTFLFQRSVKRLCYRIQLEGNLKAV